MSRRPRLLHLAQNKADPRAWTGAFRAAIAEIGDLQVVEDGDNLSDDEAAQVIGDCEILVTSWGARAIPGSLAKDPGALTYICHLTGALRQMIPVELIESSIPVTNWGDAPARAVAEGAVTLLLASLKSLRPRMQRIAEGDWRPTDDFRSGMLNRLDLGVWRRSRIVHVRRLIDLVVEHHALIVSGLVQMVVVSRLDDGGGASLGDRPLDRAQRRARRLRQCIELVAVLLR